MKIRLHPLYHIIPWLINIIGYAITICSRQIDFYTLISNETWSKILPLIIRITTIIVFIGAEFVLVKAYKSTNRQNIKFPSYLTVAAIVAAFGIGINLL